MDDRTVLNVMLGLAAATPVVALAVVLVAGRAAAAGGERLPPAMRRNAWILAAAGPVNLVVWIIFNMWLESRGPGSVLGYALAAAAFILFGFLTGFFSRLRRKPGD
jgi:hypothetical protein